MLLQLSRDRGVSMNVLASVIQTNEEQPAWVVAKVRRHLGSLQDRPVAVLGLAYKPNTDDIRESPAIRVCELMLREGATLRLYDPQANGNARRLLPGERVQFCGDPYEVARGADALITLTEWNEFRNLDLQKMKLLLAGNLLVDARNIYDPQTAVRLGFVYEGMGRRGVSRP